MPVTSFEVGHGGLGLRDSMRSFLEFAKASGSTKRAYCEVSGGKLVQGWGSAGSNTWFAAFNEVYDGVILDVSGVVTDLEALTRVETLADCQATAGTYFFDSDVLGLAPTKWDLTLDFDNGVDRWDSGAGTLYVHLTGNTDPNTLGVVALMLWTFGTGPEVIPQFGPDKLKDGALEVWTSGTNLTNWTEDNVGASGVAVNQSTTRVEGLYSARITEGGSGLTFNTGGGITQTGLRGVAGATYCFCGFYRTENLKIIGSGSPSLVARIRASVAGTTFLETNGRDTTAATNGFDIQSTDGEWRRFAFYFVCPSDTADLRVSCWLFANDSPAGGDAVSFDDLHLYRVHRFSYVEPRLNEKGLPSLSVQAKDVYFGSQTMGIGTAQLNNGGSNYFETLLSLYDFCSRSLTIRYGGAFLEGQEILYDDTRVGWTGVLEEFKVDPDYVMLKLGNLRSLLQPAFPVRTYDRNTLPSVDQRFNGRHRPIICSVPDGVRNHWPVRIDFDTEFGMGIFEVFDNSYNPAGPLGGVQPSFMTVYAYTDDEAAAREDPTRRISVAEGSEFEGSTLFPGSIRLLANPGPFEIVAGVNDCLDITLDSVTYAVFCDPGLYSVRTLQLHVEARILAVSGIGVDLQYEFTGANAHKTRFFRSSGTNMTLLIQTGVNDNRSLYPTLGFTEDADRSGGLSYYAETALYTQANADQLHFIRVNTSGYQDDSAGTYTGTSGGQIMVPPDCALFVLNKLARVPWSQIDKASFVAGRTSSPQTLGMLLGGLASVSGGKSFQLTLQEAIDRLEFSGYADIVVDGQGRFKWQPRLDDVSGAAALVATAVRDNELLSIEAWRNLEDVLNVVRVNYDQSASTGLVRTLEVTNAFVPARFSRTDARTFDTFLTSQSDAQNLATKLARIASRPINHYELVVKGTLVGALLGDIIDVSNLRRKLLDYADQSEPYLCRVKSLNIDFLNHVTRAVAFVQYFGLPPL